MTSFPITHRQTQRGTTLVEVLVTLLILSFGLLGIAMFQTKAHMGSLESYQRAQAVLLLKDMHSRMSATPSQAANYVTVGAIGTGDLDADCSVLAMGSARDLCEWSAALRGSSEQDGTTKLGAMEGARACIEQVQAPDNTTGLCQQGIYTLTVVWQGLHQTKAPSQTCGADEFGDDRLRRAVSSRVAIGVPRCRTL